MSIRRVKSTPDPDNFESLTIHLPFPSWYFCKSMPCSCTPPICITMRLPFVSRYFCRSITVRRLWESPKMGFLKKCSLWHKCASSQLWESLVAILLRWVLAILFVSCLGSNKIKHEPHHFVLVWWGGRAVQGPGQGNQTKKLKEQISRTDGSFLIWVRESLNGGSQTGA